MRKWIALACAIQLTISLVQGQTLKEWIRQKKTQQEYLLTQILANQMYLDLLTKGYRVFRTGMGIVAEWKQDEFRLHKTFFKSLGLVRPAVRRFGKIAESTAILMEIVAMHRRLNKRLTGSELSQVEKQYMRSMLEGIFKKSFTSFDQVVELLEKSFDLEDQQRLIRLQQIHEHLKEHLLMIREVEITMNYLENNRIKELKQSSDMQRLHQQK